MTALVFVPRPPLPTKVALASGCRAYTEVSQQHRSNRDGRLRPFIMHTSVSAFGNTAAAREATIGRFSPTVNVDLNVKVRANLDLVLVNPSYVFAAPVLGGQLAVGMMGIVGHNNSSLDGTITGGVGPFFSHPPGSFDSSLTGFGDLYPQASLTLEPRRAQFHDLRDGRYPSRRLRSALSQS